jgi:hypothetical protein
MLNNLSGRKRRKLRRHEGDRTLVGIRRSVSEHTALPEEAWRGHEVSVTGSRLALWSGRSVSLSDPFRLAQSRTTPGLQIEDCASLVQTHPPPNEPKTTTTIDNRNDRHLTFAGQRCLSFDLSASARCRSEIIPPQCLRNKVTDVSRDPSPARGGAVLECACRVPNGL